MFVYVKKFYSISIKLVVCRHFCSCWFVWYLHEFHFVQGKSKILYFFTVISLNNERNSLLI